MPCLLFAFSIAQRSPLYSHFSETLTGLSSIRAYGEQASFIAVNEQKLDNNNRAYYMQIQSQRWLALRLDFVGALIVGCAALVAALLAQSLSPGLVGLSISYALQVTGMLTWLIRQTVELENNMNSVERTKFYTDQLPQERPARAGEPIEYASLVAASDVPVAANAAQLVTQVLQCRTSQPSAATIANLGHRSGNQGRVSARKKILSLNHPNFGRSLACV